MKHASTKVNWQPREKERSQRIC